MELLKNIEQNIKSNYVKAQELFNQGHYVKALGHYFRSLNAAEILQDPKLEVESKKGIIVCYMRENEYHEVLTYTDDLLNNYKLDQEQHDLVSILRACAMSLLGQFRRAEQTLKSLVDNDSRRVRYRAHSELGLLYYFLHRFSDKNTLEDAHKHLMAALEISDVEGDKSRYMASSNVGLIHLEMNRLDDALQYFDQALQFAENDFYKARIYNELGRVYAFKDNMELSDEYFERAYRYALENNRLENLAFNIYYRGLVQLNLGNVNNAYSYLHTALYSFLEFRRYPEVVAIYKILHELFEETHPERAEYFEDEYYHFLNYIDPIGE